MQATLTAQNTYNPTDEMKRLLDVVQQQSTHSDLQTHIQQLEMLASAVRGQLSALREKQSAELNKTYSTTAVAQKRLKPKGSAIRKGMKKAKRKLPKPPQPQQQQQQKEQPKAVANTQQANTTANDTVNKQLAVPIKPLSNPLPNRTTPYDDAYK